ncbi:MAG: hypothetical protein LBN97_02275 [Oscillospiraceae bacterium]|jgi:hypothetical protein|nr:hypothetical protein [Oscillospiraceae bacterium]
MKISKRRLYSVPSAKKAENLEREQKLQTLAAVGDPGYKEVDPVYRLIESGDLRSNMPEAERDALPSDTVKVGTLNMKRGKLICSVLDGSGEMLLLNALKNSADSNSAKNARQRKLFDGSQIRNVPGFHKDKVLVNSGEKMSASGLVVNDILRSAHSYVNELEALLDNPNAGAAIKRMYPFLSVEQDKERLTDMRTQMENTSDPEKKSVLFRASAKLEAVIERKTTERERFAAKIAQMRDNAEKASKRFQADDFELARIPQSPVTETPLAIEPDIVYNDVNIQ